MFIEHICGCHLDPAASTYSLNDRRNAPNDRLGWVGLGWVDILSVTGMSFLQRRSSWFIFSSTDHGVPFVECKAVYKRENGDTIREPAMNVAPGKDTSACCITHFVTERIQQKKWVLLHPIRIIRAVPRYDLAVPRYREQYFAGYAVFLETAESYT